MNRYYPSVTIACATRELDVRFALADAHIILVEKLLFRLAGLVVRVSNPNTGEKACSLVNLISPEGY